MATDDLPGVAMPSREQIEMHRLCNDELPGSWRHYGGSGCLLPSIVQGKSRRFMAFGETYRMDAGPTEDQKAVQDSELAHHELKALLFMTDAVAEDVERHLARVKDFSQEVSARREELTALVHAGATEEG